MIKAGSSAAALSRGQRGRDPEQLGADTIRKRVLGGLAGNRTPGFSFAGHFLQLRWPKIGRNVAVTTMSVGEHCRDASGDINPAAFGAFVDTGLATAPRLKIEPGARQATIQLHLQFTGHPPGDELRMESRLEGFSVGDGVCQSLARGVVHSGGNPVCYASGTFVQLPAPHGVVLAPLPWQIRDWVQPRALDIAELTKDERVVFKACNKALALADQERSFIEHFWGVLPVGTREGARCSARIAPQFGNRVGHVQGGILLGLAAATAKKAAGSRHPMLSTLSAWFMSPGRGDVLRVRSHRLQAGRRFAVVRSTISTGDGACVLEAISNHAIGAKSA